MVNPALFLSPQQQELLEKVQAVSQKITARVKTSGSELELELNTDDSEANQLIPQIQEALVSCIATTLYQMFAIGGEITYKG